MSNIIYKIDKVRASQRFTKTEFAKLIGLSRDTVQNLNESSLKVETLIKIAEVLSTPIEYFFKKDAKSKAYTTADNISQVSEPTEVEHLRKRVQDLEKIIQLMEQQQQTKLNSPKKSKVKA